MRLRRRLDRAGNPFDGQSFPRPVGAEMEILADEAGAVGLREDVGGNGAELAQTLFAMKSLK